jgi:beta-xylosidase
VNTVNGDEWFIHFQDRGLYGRICHLQPVIWSEDWPVIGSVKPSDAFTGEPVYEYKKPDWVKNEDSKAEPYFPYFGECDIVNILNEKNVTANVIGEFVSSNNKIIRSLSEERFLEMPGQDEIYKVVI